jgi:hypothetical protein
MWPHLFLSPEASAWLGRRGMVDLIVNVNGVMFRRTARPDGAGVTSSCSTPRCGNARVSNPATACASGSRRTTPRMS